MAGDALDQTTAVRRAASVADVAYRLDLELAAGADTYRGVAEIAFRSGGEGTFLEFAGGTIDGFEINGNETAPDWDGQRIHLPSAAVDTRNRVVVSYENRFDVGGEGFHRFVDPADKAEYLYTGFEPYQAHRVFPCFDQPDLRATYRLAVTAPAEWEVLSAGRMLANEPVGAGRALRHYERTAPFSTYLFSVVAGPYRSVHDEHEGVPLGLYCRESLFEHLDVAELFDLTKAGLTWYRDFFDRRYPFTKYDQVFVPEFNWGGMENVGCVTYTDDVIFRDPPTSTQRIRRAEYFLHELAHMWFGDLVTMRWWDDLWLNESFATFVAYLALSEATAYPDVWQDFNSRVKAVAYRDDQKPTTHPIAAEVATTDETFLNFDQITYGKGASVLRQLMAVVGKDAFRAGLRTYIARHAFSNTTLADFLTALEEASGRDLHEWARSWLQTSSVNTVAAEVAGRQAPVVTVLQTAAAGDPTLRPHRLDVAVLRGDTVDVVPVRLDGAATTTDAPGTGLPDLVFPNYGDLAYVKVELDGRSLQTVQARLGAIGEPLFRQQLWAALWEMVRDRKLAAPTFLDMVGNHLGGETSPQILRIVTANALGALHRYMPPHLEAPARHRLVTTAAAAIDTGEDADRAVLWMRALIPAAADPDDLRLAADLVDSPPPGMVVDQDMRWQVAIRWMAFDMPGAVDRVDGEWRRDTSDRGGRRRLSAVVSAPRPEVKAEHWAKAVAGEGSVHSRAAGAVGFQFAHQRELLEPYAARFFTDVEKVASSQEWEELRGFFAGLYPRWRIDPDTVDRTSAALESTAHARLRRLLMEELDEQRRALACRELASSR